MSHQITYKVGEMYIDDKRVIFPRDAGFQNCAVLFAVDYVNGAFVPLATDSSGQLSTSVVVAGANFFYQDGASGALSDSAWTPLTFNFTSKNIIVQNDETAAGNNLLISWDGVNLANTIMPGETKKFEGFSSVGIQLQAATGKTINSYRITAW